MKLTHYIKLNLNKKDYNLLMLKSKESAKCWNDIVNISNNYYKENKKWISNYNIQPLLQNKYSLFSDIVIGISDKFCTNRTTIATLRKNGNKKAKYPYKIKEYFCIPLKYHNFKKINNILRITLAKKEYIYINFPKDLIDIPKYGEITFKNGYYYFYYINTIIEKNKIVSDIKLGIDLGEIHTISATTNNGDSLIITNRLGRSFKRYRNKKFKELDKKIKKCKKNSIKYKKLIKNKNYVSQKTKNKLKNLYHQTTSKTIDFSLKNNVSEIICGNCKSVGQNTKKRKKLIKKSRQKMSQFEVNTIINQLKYKSKLNGIKFNLINESYTSQLCPVCGYKYKSNNRTYKCCKCGYMSHRDINGAWNILNKKYKYNNIPHFKIIGIQPIKCIYNYNIVVDAVDISQS